MKLPLYRFKVNIKEGAITKVISIVKNPAMQSSYLKFNEELVKQTFALEEEKRVLIGAAAIPNKQIFRNGQKGQSDYFGFFADEDIENMVLAFSKNGYHNNMNLEHNSKAVAGAFIFQSWLLDFKKGITAPHGLEDLPDNTWMIGVKVEDEKLWSEIKNDKTFTGFSLEGLFQLEDTNESVEVKYSIEKSNKEILKSLLAEYIKDQKFKN